MAKVIKHNITYNSAPSTATLLPYNNTDSGLSATTTKGAIDELADEKADKTEVPDNLQDLNNVSISSVTNGQILKYDGSNWVNANESGGSTVSVTQIQSTGTKIATISVDSIDTDLYAPNGGASSLDDLTDVTITSPTANQELAYDGSGWENKTTRVELTQIEYDNLVAQGTDLPDVDYYIIDANGDGSQFQPIIYSTEEREIGVYIDGKPLYQKTFILPSSVTIPKETWTTVTNISSLNVDNLVSCIGQPANSQSASVNAYNNAGNLQIFLTFAWAISIITIQYTKTTDTAGSGTWTPQGVPAHHYSTDEQIVGTWVDGSTVYEKTFFLSQRTPITNDYTTYIIDDTTIYDIDNIISCEIFDSNSDSAPLTKLTYLERAVDVIKSNNKLIAFYNANNTYKMTGFILRYTKSSS